MQHQRLAAHTVVDAQHVDLAETCQQLTHTHRVTSHRGSSRLRRDHNPDSGGPHPPNRGHPTNPYSNLIREKPEKRVRRSERYTCCSPETRTPQFVGEFW